MIATTQRVHCLNNSPCVLGPKIQEKWVDVALILGCVASLTIGALATGGYFHAIGTVNATYLSWGMYGGAIVAFILEVTQVAAGKNCLRGSEDQTRLTKRISSPTEQAVSPEFNSSNPLVAPVPDSTGGLNKGSLKLPNEASSSKTEVVKHFLHEISLDPCASVVLDSRNTQSNYQELQQEPVASDWDSKRETFLKEALNTPYLQGSDLELKSIITGAQRLITSEMFECVLDQIRPHLKNHFVPPHIQLVRAITHEILDHPLLAAEAYIQLLDQNIEEKEQCIKKIQTLITQVCTSKNPLFLDFLENLDRPLLLRLKQPGNLFEKLLIQKDFTRMYFEKSLLSIKAEAKIQDQTCFICFALDSDVENWLSSTFVPDLTKIGLKPRYGPWDLSHAMDLNTFQSEIRKTDLALIICTPSLQKKCTERVRAITGCVQEVRIAQERYNDDDKAGTLFTLLLHGKRKDCIPTPILEPIFAARVEALDSERETDLYDYYCKAFRIFASLVGMSIQNAGELKQVFYDKISNAVFGNNIDSDAVEKWAEARYKPKYTL